MSRLVVYRNCFTGDVSGGDMHLSGLLGWTLDNQPSTQTVLVLPRHDGQDKAYPEVTRITRAEYPDTRLKQPIPAMYIARALKAAARVNGLVRNSDMLVAGSHFLPDVLPVAMAHRPRSAKAVFIHHIIQDMDRPNNLNTRLANLQEKICFGLIRRRFGKVIVVNKDVAERLRQLGFRDHDILLSSNFVQPLSQSVPYARKDITLAFCGRMVTQKGVDDFVEVCRQLHAEIPDFRAVMIGVGPEFERLEKQIASEKLPIELVGYVDDHTKFDIVSQAKLFVFPSVEEGWGIAVAEALSVGTPVVAYELPVYKDVFGENIHATKFKDRAELTKTVRQLLRRYDKDPHVYAAEQKRITQHTEQFRLDNVASREFSFIAE